MTDSPPDKAPSETTATTSSGFRRFSRWAGGLVILASCLLGFASCSKKEDPPNTPSVMDGVTGRSKPTPPPPANDPPLFVDVTKESGINFKHTLGDPTSYFFPQITTGGAAFFDYDQDGRLDIYLTNGSWEFEEKKPSGAAPANRLFHQKKDGTFEDTTETSGLGDTGYGIGVAVGDVNNDGFPDVYLTNYGQDRLYLNNRDGTFSDVSKQAGIDNVRWGASACFLDFDRDGRLDLFVTNYVNYQQAAKCDGNDGITDYCGPSSFTHTVDKLYHNQTVPGKGVRLVDVTATSGIAAQRGPGLGVVAGDFNADGWPDFYVANDGVANFLWMNRKDGTFIDEALLLGASHSSQGLPQAGMGVATADVDDDGRWDLFVTHLEGESNALYVTGGDETFDDESNIRGTGMPSYPMTGFGASFFDVDNDGDEDVAVANGRVERPDLSKKKAAGATAFSWDVYAEPNNILLNDGAGTFKQLRSSRDAFTSPSEVSRALCCGDIDNDGDVDLLVTNIDGRARLYRNDAAGTGHWLVVKTSIPQLGGRSAYGAEITLAAGQKKWRRQISPGTSYVSSHDPRAHFGLGEVQEIDGISVRWPDGSIEAFTCDEVDKELLIEQGKGRKS